MMLRFDEIEGLYLHINGTPGTSSIALTNGDEVVTVTSKEGLNQSIPFIGRDTGDERIHYTGTDLVGAQPGFTDETQFHDSALEMNFFPDELQDIPFGGKSGATIVYAERRRGSGTETVQLGSAGKGNDFGVGRTDTEYHLRINSITVPTAVPIVNGQDNIIILTHDGTENSAMFYVNGVESGPYTHVAQSRDFTESTLMSQTNGTLSLLALYNVAVTSQQASDLYDLVTYWITNNAAPPQGTAPTITGQPVSTISAEVGGSIGISASATGDPDPTRAWLAVLATDPDQNNWQPVASVFSGTVTETLNGDALELTIDGLLDEEDAKLAMEADNGVGRVVTNACTLTTSVSYPTSERFGPVRANDTGANYTWQLQAPGDTDNWQDVPVDGYDITASTEGDDQYLDVNSATVAQNGTLVRCKATTAYNTDGIYTNINTLNVVEDSP